MACPALIAPIQGDVCWSEFLDILIYTLKKQKLDPWGRVSPMALLVKKGLYDPDGETPLGPRPCPFMRPKPELLLPGPVERTITWAGNALRPQASELSEGDFFCCNTGFRTHDLWATSRDNSTIAPGPRSWWGISINQLFSFWVRNYLFYCTPCGLDCLTIGCTFEFYSTAFQSSLFPLFSHRSFTKFDHFHYLIKRIPTWFSSLIFLSSCVGIIFCTTCLFIKFFISLTWHLRWHNLCLHWILF